MYLQVLEREYMASLKIKFRKLMAASLFLGLFFIWGHCTMAKDSDTLIIHLNQENFVHADSFVATVTTDSIQEIDYLAVAIERKDGSKWRQIRNDIVCPCQVKCKKGLSTVKQGSHQTHTWDFLDNNCNVIGSGQYRAVIRGARTAASEDRAILFRILD